MGDHSKIEWTNATWNPLVGCEHVSPGCDHCYAARDASGRLKHLPVYSGLAEAGRFTGEVRTLPERLDQPLRWRKPRLIFVNSMSDLFHRDVPAGFIGSVWDVMGRTDRHVYQLLTKRPQRMRDLLGGWVLYEQEVWPTTDLTKYVAADDLLWPLPNVWLGTSIESDRYTFRADHLRATPAAVRWLSLEPLLSPLPSLSLEGINWVVVGGESGPRARPMHPEWARDIRDRCIEAGIPFLFKQWGEWAPLADDDPTCGDGRHNDMPVGQYGPPAALGTGIKAHMRKVGKKAAGRELDGRTWDQMPEVTR